MPIFKSGCRIGLFIHVPKAGGSSVEEYLESRFGPLGFLDRQPTRPWHLAWAKTTPQHISYSELCRLIPPQWFDVTFTVVRHPLARVVSAYNMRRDGSAIPEWLGIEQWLSEYISTARKNKFQWDGHLIPQSELIPDTCKIFRLEDGLEILKEFIDNEFGKSKRDLDVKRLNTKKNTENHTEEPSQSLQKMVERFYAADYERFGYNKTSPETARFSPPSTSLSVTNGFHRGIRSLHNRIQAYRSRKS